MVAAVRPAARLWDTTPLAPSGEWAAWALIAAGFALRAWNASRSYFNADEALHYLISNQHSLADVYRAGQTNAHPPILYFSIYFWRWLGDSEFVLRMLPGLAGTVFLWFAYKWLGCAFGKRTALIGLALFAFSPPLFSIVTELRHYSQLLLFMAGALYYLELAFAKKSTLFVGIYAAFFYLAIFTHYSALWFAAATGVYALVRIARRSLPRKAAQAWVAAQAGAAAFYAILYVTHIRKIRDSQMAKEAIDGWLRPSYYQDDQPWWTFVVDQTRAVFGYQYASPYIGLVGLALFLIGIVYLWRRRQAQVVLLTAPFVVAASASLAQLFPYGSTRHTCFLILFSYAGVSVALTWALNRIEKLRQASWAPLAVSAAIALVWLAGSDPQTYESIPPANKRQLWTDTANYIRTSLPRGTTIFTDQNTCLLLGYYLARHDVVPNSSTHEELMEYMYGGYRIAATSTWLFDADYCLRDVRRMKAAYGIPANQPVWVMSSGPGTRTYAQLFNRTARMAMAPVQTFGAAAVVFQLPGE